MKTNLSIFLVVLFSQYTVAAQSGAVRDSNKNNTESFAFIPGYKDTILGTRQRGPAINLAFIANGFKLQLKDASYKILSFLLTFDSECCIFELPSNGDQIIPRNDSIVQYKKISEATLVTIENIKVTKNNVNHRMPSLVYYVYK